MHALIRRRRLAVFVLIVGLQVALLLAVIFIEEGRQSGVEIVLESRPVDPRDPVRGDYVILGYRAERLDGLPGARPRAGENVYVVFEHRGRYWEPVTVRTQNLGADEWERGLVAIRARVDGERSMSRRSASSIPIWGSTSCPRGRACCRRRRMSMSRSPADGVARIKYLEVDGERWPGD